MRKFLVHTIGLLSAIYDKLSSYRTSWITSTCICLLISITSLIYIHQHLSKSYIMPKKLSFLSHLQISEASIPAVRSRQEYDLYPIEVVKNHTPTQTSHEIMILPFPRPPTPNIKSTSSRFVKRHPQKEKITPKQLQSKKRHPYIRASVLLWQ
ncbi:hypothetical protein [Shimazuella kribbensis]|uniref:hypothetical protein n=1 Tax=Shimazuella kribbensis TaxID=139808 RepID=UPI0004116BC1|nr:hypothetical protein [Shimazuella kribbensis]